MNWFVVFNDGTTKEYYCDLSNLEYYIYEEKKQDKIVTIVCTSNCSD